MNSFESLGVKAGSWQGILSAAQEPRRLALIHLGEIVARGELQPSGEGQWRVNCPLPAERLADGVQTFLLFQDEGEGNEPLQPGAAELASLPIITSKLINHDIQVEVALLKSELDLLKRELRRVAAAQRDQ
ncbi:hypothetical protein [Paracoccus aminophilus]|uniref:Uncharacterized protein n=1 Tax=Paracoccus aminophilus JCM 7686 TaxID=1367847 RepID=S5XKD3_PARAH|nr:hypothetical protein [Paracoccus aminophilus]AGT07664.1 hypothetical protein JCM7686_0555 [Paracoccus aminophilus JCM 7686]